MITITLPNGAAASYPDGSTALDVAKSISPKLAKAAVAARLGQQLIDLDKPITHDAELTLLTATDPEGLEVIRHSAAHLLAHAVKLLYPDAQVTIGPVIEDGFYYDFAYARPFTPDDLQKIEKKMKALVKANFPVTRRELSRDEAIALFKAEGEHYKVKIIEDIPADQTLSVYAQDSFVDLCRGPHVPRTGCLRAFKLTKLSGAYWRGDAKNEMLQRIYGTAWPDQAALDAYLKRLEEAEKRDHRRLMRVMDLGHFQVEAPGNVFWHPKGWQMVLTIREYIRRVQQAAGYQEINTPQLVDRHLWELSGHVAKFDDDMFSCQAENREYIVKPMNCPCHVQVFKQGVTSYRELPIRYAEFGSCHRNEPSGTLHGLMRARNFVQDDGHIFCTEDHIQDEVIAFIDQLHQTYRDFGFSELTYRLSTRPEKRVGEDALWDKAEAALAGALDAAGLDWSYLPGEGAFYGPKIEFSLRDCLGRVWQCGTVQVDFSTAMRLGGHYINEAGEKIAPVMIHRAMLGSIERFLGILLEHYGGHVPFWLAPVQVAILNITDKHAEYCQQLGDQLRSLGYRLHCDLRNEKIGFKIREHTLTRVPVLVIIGDQELETQTVSIRLTEGEQHQALSYDELIKRLSAL